MNFLEYGSYFDQKYEKGLRGRYMTMRVALNLLYIHSRHNIVETGCQRLPDDWGAGNSTYIFAEFISMFRGHLLTIDISAENIEACKKITVEFADRIEYVCASSLSVLPALKNPIDLVYLDSLDVPDEGNASEGQRYNLNEFKCIENLLEPGSLVLLDDNNMANGGKTKFTKMYLEQRGFKLILDHDQSLWLK